MFSQKAKLNYDLIEDEFLISVFEKYQINNLCSFIPINQNEYILKDEFIDYMKTYYNSMFIYDSISELVNNESCCYIFPKNHLIFSL